MIFGISIGYPETRATNEGRKSLACFLVFLGYPKGRNTLATCCALSYVIDSLVFNLKRGYYD
jgi:hypothetical protein